MIFLTYAGPAYKRRAEILHKSIKKYHPTATIMHTQLKENIPSGEYYPDFHKMKWENLNHILCTSTEPVVFIGSDCEIMSPMIELEEYVTYYDAVIVPHAVSPVPNRDYMVQMYSTGHANSDMVAFSPNNRARKMTEWLAKVVQENNSNGDFYDQTWVSSLPYLFDFVKILRHPGYNVGYWDIDQRDLSELRYIHYSGFLEGYPKRLSRYYSGPNATGKILKLYQDYADKLNNKGGT